MLRLIARLLLENKSPRACCCGHGKYHTTVIIEKDGKLCEFFSGVTIPHKKRFYARDSEGVYYVPEVEMHYYNQMVNRQC